ncbi:acetyltransferase [Salmonella enterica subsp. enterica]|uniref:Acetyltransferase n=1 Tax=Salmonella enterica I TaxID=59201 RepID=A0A379W1Q6_SALET|nr:acetyltransferase [Salmonella enterica subsp. enterica]
MLIRVEIPIDAPGIDALLRRSFESDAEAKLVHDLREDGFLTLGLVATDDEGQVVGYVAFSPVDVQAKIYSGSAWRRWRSMKSIAGKGWRAS